MVGTGSAGMVLFAYISFGLGGVLIIGGCIYMIVWAFCGKCTSSSKAKGKKGKAQQVGHAKYMDHMLSGTRTANATRDGDNESLNFEGHNFLPQDEEGTSKHNAKETKVQIENEGQRHAHRHGKAAHDIRDKEEGFLKRGRGKVLVGAGATATTTAIAAGTTSIIVSENQDNDQGASKNRNSNDAATWNNENNGVDTHSQSSLLYNEEIFAATEASSYGYSNNNYDTGENMRQEEYIDTQAEEVITETGSMVSAQQASEIIDVHDSDGHSPRGTSSEYKPHADNFYADSQSSLISNQETDPSTESIHHQSNTNLDMSEDVQEEETIQVEAVSADLVQTVSSSEANYEEDGHLQEGLAETGNKEHSEMLSTVFASSIQEARTVDSQDVTDYANAHDSPSLEGGSLDEPVPFISVHNIPGVVEPQEQNQYNDVHSENSLLHTRHLSAGREALDEDSQSDRSVEQNNQHSSKNLDPELLSELGQLSQHRTSFVVDEVLYNRDSTVELNAEETGLDDQEDTVLVNEAVVSAQSTDQYMAEPSLEMQNAGSQNSDSITGLNDFAPMTESEYIIQYDSDNVQRIDPAETSMLDEGESNNDQQLLGELEEIDAKDSMGRASLGKTARETEATFDMEMQDEVTTEANISSDADENDSNIVDIKESENAVSTHGVVTENEGTEEISDLKNDSDMDEENHHHLELASLPAMISPRESKKEKRLRKQEEKRSKKEQKGKEKENKKSKKKNEGNQDTFGNSIEEQEPAFEMAVDKESEPNKDSVDPQDIETVLGAHAVILEKEEQLAVMPSIISHKESKKEKKLRKEEEKRRRKEQQMKEKEDKNTTKKEDNEITAFQIVGSSGDVVVNDETKIVKNKGSSKKEKRKSWFSFRKSKHADDDADENDKNNIIEAPGTIAGTAAAVAVTSAAAVAATYNKRTDEEDQNYGNTQLQQETEHVELHQENLATVHKEPEGSLFNEGEPEQFSNNNLTSLAGSDNVDTDSLIIPESSGLWARSSPPLDERDDDKDSTSLVAMGGLSRIAEIAAIKEDEGYQTHDPDAEYSERIGHRDRDESSEQHALTEDEDLSEPKDNQERFTGDKDLEQMEITSDDANSFGETANNLDATNNYADSSYQERIVEGNEEVTMVSKVVSTNAVLDRHSISSSEEVGIVSDQDEGEVAADRSFSAPEWEDAAESHASSVGTEHSFMSSVGEVNKDDDPNLEEKNSQDIRAPHMIAPLMAASSGTFLDEYEGVQRNGESNDDDEDQEDFSIAKAILADIRGKRKLKSPAPIKQSAEGSSPNMFDELHAVLKSKKKTDRDSGEIEYDVTDDKYAGGFVRPNKHLTEENDISAFNVRARASIFEKMTPKMGESVIPSFGGLVAVQSYLRVANAPTVIVGSDGTIKSNATEPPLVSPSGDLSDADSDQVEYNHIPSSNSISNGDLETFIRSDDSYDEPIDAIKPANGHSESHSRHSSIGNTSAVLSYKAGSSSVEAPIDQSSDQGSLQNSDNHLVNGDHVNTNEHNGVLTEDQGDKQSLRGSGFDATDSVASYSQCGSDKMSADKKRDLNRLKVHDNFGEHVDNSMVF